MKQSSSYEADFFVILAQSILYKQRSVGRWERFERNLLFNNAVYLFSISNICLIKFDYLNGFLIEKALFKVFWNMYR